MTRRAAAHDYTRPGVYHITLHVVGPLGSPFGAVVTSMPPTAAPTHPVSSSRLSGRGWSMNCLAQALARQKDAWWHTN